MMVSKVTTNQEKARILALHEEKVSIVEICRRTGRSKSTVLRLISAARNLSPGEIPVHKPLPGQPRKTSKATDQLLKRAVLKNPRITAVELKSMYPSLLCKMSLRGIRNRLQKDFGLRCRQAVLEPLLTKTMLKKRLARVQVKYSTSNRVNIKPDPGEVTIKEEEIDDVAPAVEEFYCDLDGENMKAEDELLIETDPFKDLCKSESETFEFVECAPTSGLSSGVKDETFEEEVISGMDVDHIKAEEDILED